MRRLLPLFCMACILAACGPESLDFFQVATGSFSPVIDAKPAAVTLLASASPTPLGNPPAGRTNSDRSDDFSGSQVHVIYAIPAGGADRKFDVSLDLPNTVGAMNNWLAAQTGGRWLRFDTVGGVLDVTLVPLPRTDAEYEAVDSGIRKRDAIEADLKNLNLLKPEKVYAVFYEGGNPRKCADAPHPPELPGQVTVWYLQGTPPNSPPCASNPFPANQNAPPGYREFGLLHELLHTLGAVDARAPNYDNTHVNYDPRDLMYAGPQPWVIPSILDVNKSNYYNPNGLPSRIFNFANSTFLTPLILPPPLRNPLARATADRPDDVGGSQVHMIYAVPASGTDKRFDVSAATMNMIGSINNWLAGQTSGRWLRFDTAQGAPDVTFVQLPVTDAGYEAAGVRKRDAIEADLRRLRMLAPGKIYVVFYEGGNPRACGDAPHPPDLPGVVSVAYLQGTPPGAPPCAGNPFAANQTAAPGYQEFSLLHRLLLTLGAVSAAAPNHVGPQVGYDPRDLMYAGPQPWRPAILDVNKSNYFNPNGLPAGVFNFADSPFLTVLPKVPA